MKNIILILSLLLLIVFEMSRVYYIMPFPGSQQINSIAYAYWIHNNLPWVRFVFLLIIAYTGVGAWKSGRLPLRISLAVLVLFYGSVFYFFNFRFQADRMFLELKNIVFATSAENNVDPRKLVIGVVNNGDARAYPIQVLGYHHQVRDSVGNTPLLITYCTVCRTGRVFRALVNGKTERFRLVGMDHFNAMFEDATTGSWWQQATGVAVAGPLKGGKLEEFPAEQSTLEMWLNRYPNTKILQPDTNFAKQYAGLDKFDDGTTPDALEKRDSASWAPKSWVIGVEHDGYSKAYDWNAIVRTGFIQDSLPGLPLLLTLEKDTASFNVLNRQIGNMSLQFVSDSTRSYFKDANTGSVWNASGTCISGRLKGNRLAAVQASQEFWHSWRTFHPLTTQHQN